MNCKKAGAAYLLLVLMHIATVIVLILYYQFIPGAKEIGLIPNLLLSELIVVVPILLSALVGRGKEKMSNLLGFRKLSLGTILWTVLFTFLIIPLGTLMNAISMLFVDNVMLEMSGDVLNVPFFIAFLIIAVFGPLCEEIAFRGIIYRSFRTNGNLLGASLISALLFGLMHLNFNQAPYAFMLGLMMALLAEATGTTTASFICHMIFNGNTVCLMFFEKWMAGGNWERLLEQTNVDRMELLQMIPIYAGITMVTTLLAFKVLEKIAAREGRAHFLDEIKASRGKVNAANPIFSFYLLAGIGLSLAYMLADVILLK